jgi:hypothetical protein
MPLLIHTQYLLRLDLVQKSLDIMCHVTVATVADFIDVVPIKFVFCEAY